MNEPNHAACAVTLDQAGQMLGVSTPTVRRLVRSGSLAVIHLGRSVRVSHAEIARVLAQGGETSPSSATRLDTLEPRHDKPKPPKSSRSAEQIIAEALQRARR